MFRWLNDIFSDNSDLNFDAEGEPTAHELKLAAILLMVEMAGIDGDYHPDETRLIVASIQKHFSLDGADSMELLMEAYDEHKRKTAIERYLAYLKIKFSSEQKETLLAMIIKVTQADDKLEEAEKALLKRFQKALELDESAVDRARLKARLNDV